MTASSANMANTAAMIQAAPARSARWGVVPKANTCSARNISTFAQNIKTVQKRSKAVSRMYTLLRSCKQQKVIRRIMLFLLDERVEWPEWHKQQWSEDSVWPLSWRGSPSTPPAHVLWICVNWKIIEPKCIAVSSYKSFLRSPNKLNFRAQAFPFAFV